MIIAILLASNLILTSTQTPWEKTTTVGYSIDKGELDDTEGFGAAYFKVYENNRSGKEEWHSYGYQANRQAKEFQEEVEHVFGKGNVVTDSLRHLIIAYKNSGCTKERTPS